MQPSLDPSIPLAPLPYSSAVTDAELAALEASFDEDLVRASVLREPAWSQDDHERREREASIDDCSPCRVCGGPIAAGCGDLHAGCEL